MTAGTTDARRRSFDRDPQTYQRARPPYPARVYEILSTECGLAPDCRVLEIGAGTGQATGELLARGAEVVAVEPGRELAATLAGRFRGQPCQVIQADFETAEVPAGPYRLAVSATAFHWLDPAAALPKLARLLAPSGTLAVWWTVFTDPAQPTKFRTALDRLYARYLPDERRDRAPGPLGVESWSRTLRSGGWFGPVAAELISWTQRLTPESARLLWATFPNVMELPPDRRARFLDGVGQLVADLGGSVDDPRVTAIYRTRLTT